MTVSVWRIARETPEYASDAMTGDGARIGGGRWNPQGMPVVYTACNVSLACLESSAHLSAASTQRDRFLIRIDVPIAIWERARVLTCETAPVGWDAVPAALTSLDLGRKWLLDPEGPALLRVPSSVVPEESNILINPSHPDAKKLKTVKLRRWHYDDRVFGNLPEVGVPTFNDGKLVIEADVNLYMTAHARDRPSASGHAHPA